MTLLAGASLQSSGPPNTLRRPLPPLSILTVPLLAGFDVHDPQLWARLLPTWTLESTHDAEGKVAPDAEQVNRLVSPAEQSQARAGLLAHLTADGRSVTLHVFAHHLTELQALAESVTDNMRMQLSRGVSTETRVTIAIMIGGVRHDLTSGRVRMGRNGVLSSFCQSNKYALNVILAVLLITLSVVLVVTPSGPYMALGKFCGPRY